MTNKAGSGAGAGVHALAAQKIITAAFARLARLDPQLRTFAAQTLEDAAAGVEAEARDEVDPDRKRLLRAVLETIELMRESTLGDPVPKKAH